METADVAIVGAGVVGAAIAWRCRSRGLSVVLIDPEPGSGATWTAAGMLAPFTELHYAEQPLLRLSLESMRRWPAWAAELGPDIGYLSRPTLSVAWDGADLAALRDVQAFGARLGLHSHELTGREIRALVPALAPGLPGGLLVEDDHSVDPRALHGRLLSDAPVVRQRAVALTSGSVTLDDGSSVSAGAVVLAAGAWSSPLLPGLPPVRPVKGQTLRLRPRGERLLDQVVRASVKGSPVYVVPRSDGSVVVGASSEETGFDAWSRAGAVYELLRDAISLLPLLAEAELLEISVGLRPGTPDNAPLIGRLDEVIVATGHYRNGVLLAPATADLVTELVVSGAVPDALVPFSPTRFSAVHV